MAPPGLPRHRLAPLLAVLCACGPGASSTNPTMPPTTTSEPAPTTSTTPASPHELATVELAALRGQADKHPLLAPWQGPHGGVPPFDRATDIPAALELGIKVRDAEIKTITSNPEAATFTNTIVPLEDAGRHLDRAETVFSVLVSSMKDDKVAALDREWAPKLTEAWDRLVFNPDLFGRIRTVYEARASLGADERRVVELLHLRLVKAGAQLDAAKKARMGAINQELSTLFSDFENKLLADENTWITLTDRDLAGLPESLRAAYKAAADERKLTGWAVVNTRSSVDPFLATSSRRDLRERVWRAFKSRGDQGNGNDTKGVIARIVALRAERAALLGYPSHAHWRMVDTMAVDPAKAKDLMMRVWPAAVARVGEEVKAMSALAKKDKVTTFEPWDYLYYAEKVRKAKYAIDQDEVKAYFELGNMIAASFYMAERLYGLAFKEITGTVSVFHPEVRVWEVTDKASGQHVGLFYGDYFARAGKRSGAWAQGYRGFETFTGTTRTAITSNNNNFVRGAAGTPVLISLDDAQTLFHEFGHALHGLLSTVAYPTLGNTPRDFVEYPSQVHEMWVMTRPVLDQFAKHYQTGKPMPQALVDKALAAATFNQGYATVEYLSSAILDMELHTAANPGAFDAAAFEKETLARIGAPRQVAMRHRLPQFGHLFSSDAYSAGYYSYLWSEVMDADTRAAFREAGDVFAPAVAAKLRKHILADGNTVDRGEAYRAFRGRDPDVKALLEKRGFPTK